MARILLYRTCGDITALKSIGSKQSISSTIPGFVPGQIDEESRYPGALYSNFNLRVNDVITARCWYDSILNNGGSKPTICFSSLFGNDNLNFIYNSHVPGDVHEATSDKIVHTIPEISISFDSFNEGAVIKNFTFEIYAEMDIDKEYIRSIPMHFNNKSIDRFKVELDESKISSCGLLLKYDGTYHTIMWRPSTDGSRLIFGTREVSLNSNPVTVRNIVSEGLSLSALRSVSTLNDLKDKDVEWIVAYYPKDKSVGDLEAMPISILPIYESDFRLIKLAQIKNGLQLEEDLQSLKTSYDALKVITSISKGDDLGSYNVNELLIILKNTIDSITTGEGGTGGSLGNLEQQINIINQKIIKDVVKLELNFTNNVIVLPDNIGSLVPNIDTTKQYPVYNIDNTIIFNEIGEQLLFDFTINQFIGKPCKPNTSGNTVTYIEITENFSFKVFAIGSFTFVNLPADALLDNQEMTLLAYNKVLNQIILNLSNNTELIQEIKVLISNEVIQQQITQITNVLAQRITYIEQNGCKVSNEYISTVINDIDIATDIKVTSEKAVAIAISNISTNIKNEINTEIININGRIDALQNVVEKVDKIAVTGSVPVTDFALSEVPNAIELVVNINGVDYHENEAFTANRSEKKITWTATKVNGGFDITQRLTPVVRIVYKVGKKLEYVPGRRVEN